MLLAGMMGAGKSTVGRALAGRLGWSFFDTDVLVEDASGMSIAEVFLERGEAGFRALEERALEGLPKTRCVVALGGGALIAPANRERLLASGTLVWLVARAETLAARLDPGDTRPLLEGLEGPGRLERLRALAEERAPIYSLASIRVATDGLDVGEVCQAVCEALEREDAA